MNLKSLKQSISLRNRWNYKGDDWWEWETFIDDSGSGALNDIDHVEYILHPTFPNPIRTVKTRKGGFVLRNSGWGTFPLRAFVYTKSGKKFRLDGELVLKYDPEQGSTG